MAKKPPLGLGGTGLQKGDIDLTSHVSWGPN